MLSLTLTQENHQRLRNTPVSFSFVVFPTAFCLHILEEKLRIYNLYKPVQHIIDISLSPEFTASDKMAAHKKKIKNKIPARLYINIPHGEISNKGKTEASK